MAEDRLMPGSARPADEDFVAVGYFTIMQMRGGKVQGRDLHLLRLRQASAQLWGAGTDKSLLRRAIGKGSLLGGLEDCTLRVCVRPCTPGGSLAGGMAAPSPFSYDSGQPEGGARRPL